MALQGTVGIAETCSLVKDGGAQLALCDGLDQGSMSDPLVWYPVLGLGAVVGASGSISQGPSPGRGSGWR